MADANAALRLEPNSARAMLAKGAANVGSNAAAALRDLAEAEKRGEKSARLYCEQGLAYCALKRYDKALEAADQALKIDPKEPRAYGLRGQALTEQKGLNAALEDLNKAVDLDRTSGYGWGVRGRVMLNWDVALGPAPPDIVRLRQLNPTCRESSLPALLAMPHLDRAVQFDPDNPRYCCDLGWACMQSGYVREAVRNLDRAVELNPKFVLAYERRMHLRVALRDYKGGDADAQKLIELDPSNFAGHHAHGYYMCMIGGNMPEGLKEIELAIKLDPQHATRDYAVRALIRLAQGKPSEAVADASKALEINPRTIDAHFIRGQAFMKLKEFTKAIGDFDVLIRVSPEVAGYWTLRAEARARLGDTKGAVEDNSQALRVSPHFPCASFQRGLCRMVLRDFDGAASDLRDALAHGIERLSFAGGCPGDAAAHRELGEILYRQGNSEAALAEYDLALKLFPRDALALTKRGELKYKLRDYRGAIEDFNRALESNPNLPLSYRGRGFSKHATGDYAGAIADFNGAVRLSPSDPCAYMGRGTAKIAMDNCEGGLEDLDLAIRLARGEAADNPAGAAAPTAASGVAEDTTAGDVNSPFGYLAGNERSTTPSPTGNADSSVLAEIYNNRGWACYNMGQFARAVKEYDQASRIQPPNLANLMNRSNAKGYPGLKRHLILSAISYLFLAKTNQRLREKKIRVDRLPGAYRHLGADSIVVDERAGIGAVPGTHREKDPAGTTPRRLRSPLPHQANSPSFAEYGHQVDRNSGL